MSAQELKMWMKTNQKDVIDVAAATKLDPQTIKRYLEGKRVHRSTEVAFAHLIQSMPKHPPEPPKAA